MSGLAANHAFGTVTLTVGPNINITKSVTNNAEECIAVSPLNPNFMFVDDTWATQPQYSTDGGATWYDSDVSALPGTLGDVAAAWDTFGNLFLVQFGTTDSIAVGLSTNRGASFRLVYQASINNTDQPSVTTGPGAVSGQGSVWISYTDSPGRLRVQGATVNGLGVVGSFGSAAIAPGPGGDFGDIAVGPKGQVMVAYQDPNSGEGPDAILINLDPDGLGALGFGNTNVATSTQVGGFASIPAQPQRSIDAEAGLAWDRSAGPHNGRVYLLYTDRPSTTSDDTDIYVRFSDNNGTNWSSRVRVNDDPVGNGKSQFLPRIALDQTTGYIAASFYDCRNSANNNRPELWAAVSIDGGLSFLPNVKVSEGVSSALVFDVADRGFDFGDYTGLVFNAGAFYPCWADNSNSTGDNPDGASSFFDMYTAKVTVTLTVQLVNPRFIGTNFVVSVQTDSGGRNYFLETTPSLVNPSWSQSAAAIAGDGTLKNFTATNAIAPQGFYRVRVQ